ncbi:MAG: hypothetical protein COA78_10375 [Blastopirellula sp.]|nr:MAG: hypothetical protein COA78_10375 [Blastopirellula sp.]
MSKPTILIADDDRDLTDLISLRCQHLGLNVITANDADDAILKINTFLPNIVCLDVSMPSGNGLDICELMSADQLTAQIPVIIFTGNPNHEIVKRCFTSCAYYIPKCSDTWSRIEPLLRELFDLHSGTKDNLTMTPTKQNHVSNNDNLPGSGDQNNALDLVFRALGLDEDSFTVSANQKESNAPPWILHVEDDEELSNSLKLRLESHGVAVVRAFAGMEGYRTAFTQPADLIILDVDMPDGRGDYVLRRLKENIVTKDIPVIILTGRKDRALERKMLNLGAEKYFTKPYIFDDILEELLKHINILPTSSNVENKLLALS